MNLHKEITHPLNKGKNIAETSRGLLSPSVILTPTGKISNSKVRFCLFLTLCKWNHTIRPHVPGCFVQHYVFELHSCCCMQFVNPCFYVVFHRMTISQYMDSFCWWTSVSFSVLATLYRAAMCVCFGAHMYTFLFCIYLRMVLPGGQVCICLALVDIVK